MTAPVVVAEDELRWNVKCWADGCDHVIAVPKAYTDHTGLRVVVPAPEPRGCVSHPSAS